MKKKEIVIRTATSADVDGVLELDHLVWVDFPTTKEKLQRRVEIFPQGNLVAVNTATGKIVGYLCLMFLDFEPAEFPCSWNEITREGTIRTHNPEGKYMYGVALTVHPDYSHIGAKLQIYGWGVGLGYHRLGCYLGSPIPGFAKWKEKNPELTVEDYVYRERNNGMPLDPELAYYKRSGFNIVRILPGYEPDPKSLDYGVLVYCSNVFYHVPTRVLRRLAGWAVKRWGFKTLRIVGVI